MSATVQRVIGIVVRLVTGMATIGAGLAVALPALARESASTGRRTMTGALWGLLAAVVGVVIFFFLLNGINSA